MAEWLGKGLQNLVQRFESASDLKPTPPGVGFFNKWCMESKIRVIIDSVKHPESGAGLHDGGFIESINLDSDAQKLVVTMRFEKQRDPFAKNLKKRLQEVLDAAKSDIGLTSEEARVTIMVKEGVAPRKKVKKIEDLTTTGGIAHTIAISSGKGGVGKSSVTANLAIALRDLGYRVGVLDADIYGPSQPRMFGLEGYAPDAIVEKDSEGVEREYITPTVAHDIKVMSIGFFIKATDPLLWRGTMASNALKQLLHQTKWGTLDFLLVDLPPGTGDIHLTILDSIKFSAAVIVSTPQGVALADVVRGVEMFNHEKVQVPIAGIIENMAYFEPLDAPDKRYYIFGKGGATRYAAERGLELLAEVPIREAIVEGGEAGTPAAAGDEMLAEIYKGIAEKLLKC